MQASTVKTAAKVMYAMGVYTLVMSLFWIFLTEVVFVSDFLAYTSQSHGDFLANSPKPAELYIITKKLFGVALLLISLLIMLTTRKSYSRGEKWSWYALMTTGVGLWGSLIGYRIVIGYIAPSIVTFMIGAALFVIGIALPAKAILRGNPTWSDVRANSGKFFPRRTCPALAFYYQSWERAAFAVKTAP